MPELLEVERYRQLAEQGLLGRPIVAVKAEDPFYLKGGLAAVDLEILVGCQFTAARRTGKRLFLDTELEGDAGPVLGLRFGMTGRLEVAPAPAPGNGHPGCASDASAGRYQRFAVLFADGGCFGVRDPRRLGGVELSPLESRLGYDAATVTQGQLASVLSISRAPLKSRLMDQSKLAGIGNLIADEVLWRAGLCPRRPASTVTVPETRRLHRRLRQALAEMGERGGSHTGDLMAHRVPGGTCPLDGQPLRREKVGGRTTFWCPAHQF